MPFGKAGFPLQAKRRFSAKTHNKQQGMALVIINTAFIYS
jgi:hypothetical protein